jgi:hypothetical protein
MEKTNRLYKTLKKVKLFSSLDSKSLSLIEKKQELFHIKKMNISAEKAILQKVCT